MGFFSLSLKFTRNFPRLCLSLFQFHNLFWSTAKPLEESKNLLSLKQCFIFELFVSFELSSVSLLLCGTNIRFLYPSSMAPILSHENAFSLHFCSVQVISSSRSHRPLIQASSSHSIHLLNFLVGKLYFFSAKKSFSAVPKSSFIV